MPDFTVIDNPIWWALTTAQQPIARVNGLARRYPSDVSPLAAMERPTPQAFADLSVLVKPDERVALFTPEPIEIPADWQILRTHDLDQMICSKAASSPSISPIELHPADVPEMLALTAATQPGPFLPGTIRMGHYYGLRSNEQQLIAMAGMRLRLDSFTEISAVCTDPRFRGRGYGLALVSWLASQIIADGRIPFLHVLSENNAKSVYRKAGFTDRRSLCLTVISPQHAGTESGRGRSS